jgi:hypothetical protein
VDSFDDPLVIGFHQAFLLIYLIGIVVQMRWLYRTMAVQTDNADAA